MASLHKRANSPFWWGKFSDETGTVRFRTTKKTKRSDALEVLLGWKHIADDAKQGELTQATVLRTMNEILERTTGQRQEVAKTDEFFETWLAAKTRTGKSKGTSARYGSVLRGFIKLLGPQRVKMSIGTITTGDVEAFRDAELGSGKSHSSANLAVRILRAVLNDAVRKGLMARNTANAVELLDDQSQERQPFSDEQIKKLLKVADTEWKGMILLGAHAGLRIGDAASITWSAVDVAKGTLTFVPQKNSRRKPKPQVIAMHPELLAYFVALPSSDNPKDPVFATLHARSAGGHQGLSNTFKPLMEKAKINRNTGPKGEGKGRSFSAFSFHSLRHAFISRLANADVTADVRKEIVGHSSDEIHRRYTHLDLSAQRRALERIKGFVVPE